MRNTIITAIAATLIATSFSPANAGMAGLKAADTPSPAAQSMVQKTKSKAFWIGVGALATTAIIVGSYRAHARRHARRCNRWARKCNWGNERACWKLDTRC